MTALTLPAFPNWVPYNELLLSGKLSAKTRSWGWSHTGQTLLYTSSRVATAIVEAHGLDISKIPQGAIVGIGNLQPVRKATGEERARTEREFANGGPDTGIYAGEYLYEFWDLRRFRTPISFTPPQGAVSVIKVPLSLVYEAMRRIHLHPNIICERAGCGKRDAIAPTALGWLCQYCRSVDRRHINSVRRLGGVPRIITVSGQILPASLYDRR